MFVAVITKDFGLTKIGDLVLINPKDITISSFVWVQAEDPTGPYPFPAAWRCLKKSEFQILGEL